MPVGNDGVKERSEAAEAGRTKANGQGNGQLSKSSCPFAFALYSFAYQKLNSALTRASRGVRMVFGWSHVPKGM